MSTVLQQQYPDNSSLIGFRLFTEVDGLRADLLADLSEVMPSAKEPDRPYLTSQFHIPVYHHRLFVDAWTTRAFDALSARRWPWIAGGAGATFSVLTAALLFVQVHAREKQNLVVEALRKANAEVLTFARERENFARDLHDGSIQNLYALGLRLRHLENSPPGDALRLRNDLQACRTLLDCSITDLRQFMESATPDPGASVDTAAALAQLANTLRQNSSIPIHSSFDPLCRLIPAKIAAHLLNFVREAVSNAIRHSNASQINVMLERSQDQPGWRVSITDNGCGFDPSSRPHNGKHGLKNLLARALDLGGNVTINSAAGRGTEIILIFNTTFL